MKLRTFIRQIRRSKSKSPVYRAKEMPSQMQHGIQQTGYVELVEFRECVRAIAMHFREQFCIKIITKLI